MHTQHIQVLCHMLKLMACDCVACMQEWWVLSNIILPPELALYMCAHGNKHTSHTYIHTYIQ